MKAIGQVLAFVGGMFLVSSVAAQDSGSANAELTAELARLKLENQILDEQKKQLVSKSMEGVVLPTGKIERAAESVVPSIAVFAALGAIQQVGAELCTVLPAEGMVILTPLNLRNLSEQRVAVKAYLVQLKDSVKQAEADLKRQPQEAQPLGDVATAGVGSMLLGLDAIGAVGKSLAGLVNLFKTDRTIAKVDVATDTVETAMRVALLNCSNAPKRSIVDPADTPISSATVFEATDLESAAKDLRAQVVASQQAQEADQKKLDALTGKEPEAKELKRRIDARDAKLKVAGNRLEAAQTALDKLRAVDASTGISPIVALARMDAIHSKYVGVSEPPPVLSLKVLHASGYSQISKAWWRNDRLDASSGIALAYFLTKQNGTVISTNVYYFQTPWQRVSHEKSKFGSGLRSYVEKPTAANAAAREGN
jgi:hypothetical protein